MHSSPQFARVRLATLPSAFREAAADSGKHEFLRVIREAPNALDSAPDTRRGRGAAEALSVLARTRGPRVPPLCLCLGRVIVTSAQPASCAGLVPPPCLATVPANKDYHATTPQRGHATSPQRGTVAQVPKTGGEATPRRTSSWKQVVGATLFKQSFPRPNAV